MRVGVGAREMHSMSGQLNCRSAIFTTHSHLVLWFALLLAICSPSQAVFLPNFTNCMTASIQTSVPIPLQWVPEAVWVVYGPGPSYNLNITVYGNVTGQRDNNALPPMDSPLWNEANFTNGKIRDHDPTLDNVNHYSATLFNNLNVLSYTPFISGPVKFCEATNRQCPICPVFNAYVDPRDLLAQT